MTFIDQSLRHYNLRPNLKIQQNRVFYIQEAKNVPSKKKAKQKFSQQKFFFQVIAILLLTRRNRTKLLVSGQRVE